MQVALKNDRPGGKVIIYTKKRPFFGRNEQAKLSKKMLRIQNMIEHETHCEKLIADAV